MGPLIINVEACALSLGHQRHHVPPSQDFWGSDPPLGSPVVTDDPPLIFVDPYLRPLAVVFLCERLQEDVIMLVRALFAQRPVKPAYNRQCSPLHLAPLLSGHEMGDLRVQTLVRNRSSPKRVRRRRKCQRARHFLGAEPIRMQQYTRLLHKLLAPNTAVQTATQLHRSRRLKRSSRMQHIGGIHRDARRAVKLQPTYHMVHTPAQVRDDASSFTSLGPHTIGNSIQQRRHKCRTIHQYGLELGLQR
mmetsp:Transcript_18898/g.45612  ORF Transcript_18898/g.45612 Transcript_18898/m.45612 type:complete len:247 (+) Transcript_18898:638-1378(+)